MCNYGIGVSVHKNRNEGKTLNELIFVRRPRGHLWGKTYFAYVVKFVRIVPIGHREFFARNAHVVIFV